MKKILCLLLALGMPLASLSAQEKPKTALVNIQSLFRDYYKTHEAQAQINAERAVRRGNARWQSGLAEWHKDCRIRQEE